MHDALQNHEATIYSVGICSTAPESEKVFKQDHNLFAETVSVPELVIQLDEIAKQVQSNHKPSNSRNKKKNKKQGKLQKQKLQEIHNNSDLIFNLDF